MSFQAASWKVCSGASTQGTREGLWRGRRGLTDPPRKSQGPGLSFNLLLPMLALRVLQLGHTLPNGNLGAAAIQVVQVGPGLLGDLPVVSAYRPQRPPPVRAGLALTPSCPCPSMEPWAWQGGSRRAATGSVHSCQMGISAFPSTTPTLGGPHISGSAPCLPEVGFTGRAAGKASRGR